jgi:hypothetical protein
MGLDSLIGRFTKKKPEAIDDSGVAEELELQRQEIVAHQAAGSGTFEDNKRLEQLTTTLAGLRAKEAKLKPRGEGNEEREAA